MAQISWTRGVCGPFFLSSMLSVCVCVIMLAACTSDTAQWLLSCPARVFKEGALPIVLAK